jgi:glycosidase
MSMSSTRALAALVTLIAVAVTGGTAAAKGPDHKAQHSLRAPLTGENFYFVMADRFENGLTGNDDGEIDSTDPKVTGLDPEHKGFYHGGDLAGLLERIDYIEGLGTTAIWLTPSFKNRAYQPADDSAGYHGYWITDFTQIDPHLGTNAELRALVDAAHARGMKVFFDIITNHTADVIDYREGSRPAYVSKDREPYRTASGTPFDDADYAGTGRFPALSADASFPFTPFVPAGLPTKEPDWLNDPTLYHNRGNTTFVGENSLYGDFFGLDDLFTEHPRVVSGMTEIYETWIEDFSIDGFRIDTMKHVNDEFWQQFLPDVLDFAREQGKREFFMFGEVFDTTRPFTSHFTTTDKAQAVIDFPFQAAAQRFAANSAATDDLREFFTGDDWYTDADSNAYQLPTFLGNHDMGRIGRFVQQANPGAEDEELLARDRLAHELMYLSRGNPVIYYGDEQGFTGDGGDQDARQDMFPSKVGTYNDDDLIGTPATTATANFDTTHPLYESIEALAKLTRANPALRDGAQQHRLSRSGPGIYAFSRIDRSQQREYVVALNNAETEQTAQVPTYSAGMRFTRIYDDAGAATTGADKRLSVTVPPLSAVVYRADGRLAKGRKAPDIGLPAPEAAADRIEVAADVAGDGFNEVTFLAKAGKGGFKPIGTDDNRPYRVFHDVSGYEPGTRVQYKAVVLDNAGNARTTGARSTRVAEPAIALEAPAEGSKVRSGAEVRAVVTPDDADNVVRFERRVGTGDWETIGTDASSPVYTVFDEFAQPEGTAISYRAIVDYGAGTVTSAPRNVTVAPPPRTTALVHYQRAGGDYANWGLHLWGDAIADGVETAWESPRMPTRTEPNGTVTFEIPLEDDTKPVNFIVHQPSGDNVPLTRDPGGNRSFLPIDHQEIWLKGGDATVYTTPQF